MADRNSIRILTINRGSSSLKFALYDMGKSERLVLSGELKKLNSPTGFFQAKDADGKILVKKSFDLADHHDADGIFLDWLKSFGKSLGAIGHRVVHGGARFRRPHVVTSELLASLKEIIPLDPEHLPQEINVIETVGKTYRSLKQVACFDTAFHRNMPEVAQTFALPRFLKKEGVIRYGFHGLSYEYIMNELGNKAGHEAAKGRVIIAHLGSGASMAAVKGGQSVDTTMGFTPTGGLMMSSRSGDLDPGTILYLIERKALHSSTVNRIVNRHSGLLGVSGLSSDMEVLLAKETENTSADEAVKLFCYQAKKFLGSLSAVLGGLDTLIFTAGIGENAPAIRWRICKDLEYLGVHLDSSRNDGNASIISSENSPVTVRVMKTNEELMIARHTCNLVKNFS